jgi:hypothetical protein
MNRRLRADLELGLNVHGVIVLLLEKRGPGWLDERHGGCLGGSFLELPLERHSLIG